MKVLRQPFFSAEERLSAEILLKSPRGDPLKGTAMQGTGVQPPPEVFPFSVFLETTLF
ncbi:MULTISPECIES: hypothetical protein [Caproicibacterium]|uniref:Uncharacterized protein n=1 Tax=Caproicibacterium argilliputei TaxID=3030016 RepID=A0AA97D8R1_9FIRM|nr:hypothetical protein [Caproicibacterium argilliputei]WOC31118.1 hypothetical protein PXC00_07715 [Caproicibacterium argilliputei]